MRLHVVSDNETGFTLIEVMVAMVVLAFGLLGVMATFQWSQHAVQYGAVGAVALSMAEARIEAKRAAPWSALLEDDLNADGTIDIRMHDDGLNDDQRGGDGTYTASIDQDGVHLIWTVALDRLGPLQGVAAATIQAHAQYAIGPRYSREITLVTIRTNPTYIGLR